ncbi:MAG: DOMON domain-containing protein [Spirochaetota bacterium]
MLVLTSAILFLAGCSAEEAESADSADAGMASESSSPEPESSDTNETDSSSEDATNDEAEEPDFETIEEVDMSFSWRIMGEDLEVELSGPTTGWIAVGFKPSRGMKDANILIGYVDGADVVMTDQFGTTMVAHRPDTDLGGESNTEVISGEEANGTTTIRFRLPLDSGDEYDQPLSADEEMRVIFAYGPDGADDTSTYHAERGGVDMSL